MQRDRRDLSRGHVAGAAPVGTAERPGTCPGPCPLNPKGFEVVSFSIGEGAGVAPSPIENHGSGTFVQQAIQLW